MRLSKKISGVFEIKSLIQLLLHVLLVLLVIVAAAILQRRVNQAELSESTFNGFDRITVSSELPFDASARPRQQEQLLLLGLALEALRLHHHLLHFGLLRRLDQARFVLCGLHILVEQNALILVHRLLCILNTTSSFHLLFFLKS